jgi:hypothetical protein
MLIDFGNLYFFNLMLHIFTIIGLITYEINNAKRKGIKTGFVKKIINNKKIHIIINIAIFFFVSLGFPLKNIFKIVS